MELRIRCQTNNHGVKSIINIKNSQVNVVNKLKDSNGKITTDSAEMASRFNDFFVNVADSITKKIPRSPKSPLDYLGDENPHSFFIGPSAPIEASDVINALKSDKSVGPNSIPIKLLKISPYISSPLSQSINESFQSGVFPEKMQHAKVIPLCKRGCPETVLLIDQYPSCLVSVKSQRH